MKTGLLLIQLGSPASTSWNDVRRFLVQFLGDPRLVVPAPKAWGLLVRAVIAPLRAFRSGRQYRSIIGDGDLPLVAFSRAFARQVEYALADSGVLVRYAFQCGHAPGISEAVGSLLAEGCRKIRVVPLYPQFAEATTVAALDGVSKACEDLPNVDVEVVPHFFDTQSYAKAWARSIAAKLREPVSGGKPAVLLLSFHGYPVARCRQGDPYQRHCESSALAIWKELCCMLEPELHPETYQICYQSRFGGDEWIGPATLDVVRDLAGKGTGLVALAAPSFVADNLETMYELDCEIRQVFAESLQGTGRLVLCPCPNDEPAWAQEFSLEIGLQAKAVNLEMLRSHWKRFYGQR